MRYHTQAAGPAAFAGAAACLPGALAEVRATVAAAAPSISGSTLYTGAPGVAWALAKAARQEPALGALAAQLAAAAAARRGARRHVAESVMDGQAGAAAAQALVARALDPSADVQRHLQQFAAAAARAADASAADVSDEVLYGRAGTILGALTLQRELGASPLDAASLTAICAAILQSGRATSAALGLPARGGPPLFYTWPEGGGRGDPYLGAAHGLVGIVHALLHCWDLLPGIDARAQPDVVATLDYILSLQADVPGRPAGSGGHWPVMCHLGGGAAAAAAAAREPVLVHWCHGAPGVAMTMCKARQVTGDQRYLDAAIAAGELVWERGLLTKGPGQCHGVSGNAYALLAVWRATWDPLWLSRAHCFGAFLAGAGRADWRAPDHPWSLFEGLAGALVLLSDLAADPETARFPFYEV